MTSMIVETANTQHVAAVVIADVMTPPPAVDYLAWAEANIVFSERESPFPGPYNRTLFPYFDEILRALGPADPCRIVTLKKSAQLGGTVLANIFVGGSMAMDPGDVLYVHPTESNAQRWSKMKLAPMLKGTASLARLFPMRSRDGLDSVLYKERVDGRGAIQISGANSPASLSQRWRSGNAGRQPVPCPRVRQDPEGLDTTGRARMPDHRQFPEGQPGAAVPAMPALRPLPGAGMGEHAGRPR